MAAATTTTEASLDDEVPLDPILKLLHLRFTANNEVSSPKERTDALKAIKDEILAHNMLPYYELIKENIDVSLTEAEIAKMKKENTERSEKIEATIKDAKDNLGETEVRLAHQAKVDFYAELGSLNECLQASAACNEVTIANGPKMDLCFQRIRLGLAFSDNDIVNKAMTDAKELSKKGDWERRNRLKVYEGVCSVANRNFAKGTELLLDAIATFAATELLSYDDFINLTSIAALVTLPRAEIKAKIVDSPEVLSAHSKEVVELVTAIYQCRYAELFPLLAGVCNLMRQNCFLTPHVNYFFREVRILAFNQFLDSYRSVTLQSMAFSFAIPVNVLDHMLFTLISNDRLSCKIDRVSGNVVTYRGDHMNLHYHRIIKEGDILLNKVQKLSRVIEM